MEREKISLSIVVPCYKVERYLPRCLDSLLVQTLKEIEIICVNDGSPDNSLSILKEYAGRFGRRIVIIDKENEGVWKARRDGAAAAKGDYIGFIDSDDYVREDYAEKLYNAAVKQDADIACCGFDRIDMETEKPYSREMTKFRYTRFDIQKDPGLMLEVNAALWNKIYRAGLLKKMKEIEHIPKVLDDWMFAQLVYLHAGVITFVNESLICYRVRRDSIINNIKPDTIPGVYTAVREVKAIYKQDNPVLLSFLDAAAFLHLGISFMYRLSEEKDFARILKKNTRFLDREFPNWRKSPYITRSYVRSHKGANRKLLIVRSIYRLHLFRPFLSAYRFVTGRLGIDIKW